MTCPPHDRGYQALLSPEPTHTHALLRSAHANGSMSSLDGRGHGPIAPRSDSSDTLHGLAQDQGHKSDSEYSDEDDELQTQERRPLLTTSSDNDDTNNNNKHVRYHQQQRQTTRVAWVQALQRFLGEITGSEYLENTGSVARDHLANERTYLAWLRTSLSTISVGVGITQLFRLDRAVEHDPYLKTWGRPVGLVFIVMAMLFLSFAFVRYFHCQTTMTRGYFPASRGIVVFTSTLTLFSMVGLMLAVLFKR